MRLTRLPHTGLLALLAVAPAWAAAPPAPAADARLRGIDADIARALAAFRVPGMAVAIVKDGRVVLEKGYGVKRTGEAEPVDERTLFGIASNTKAFTCAALSRLAEEGRLSWDDPVTRHLPEFQMYDPWVTREVTLRDLVTHRAGLGLGAGDLMWWPPTSFTRAEIVRGIRYLKPATSLRSRYAYNNVMYAAAGEVVARASGKSWDEFVTERILQPLGMAGTTTSVKATQAAGSRAAPHILRGGAQTPIEPGAFDNIGAAAGINSSASDMARWVRMLLECGRGKEAPAGETCVLKPASIRQMWSAQTVQGTGEPAPGLEALRANFAAYGLGFGLRDFRGRKLVAHSGGLPGFVSYVAMMPEERLGIVILTNQEETAAYRAVAYRILDAYLGPPSPPVDWVAALGKAAAEEETKAREAVAKAAAARAADSRPSLPLSRYAGRYRDPWYGEAALAEEGGRLVLDMTRTPGMVADLEHFQYDTFVARWRQAFMSDAAPADAYVTFTLKADGTIAEMKMLPVSPAIDFSFDYQDLSFTPVPAEPPARR